ncbi:hypothetical protein [Georgenia sp. SUBG003]|uniref:hypothetical protein n=1 Tax=Georgenia sp. SUBG003 TaxID=1497974 RepID=UPI003AB59CC5
MLRSNDLLGEEGDGDTVRAGALLSDDELARRHGETDRRTFAERAAADRTWVYGHVIVDEAQEVSAMTWRTLFRRCPAGSMTVVGDVHQASGPTAVESWELALAPHTRARVRRAELTVSYRTPQEVMDAALPVLRALDAAAPRSRLRTVHRCRARAGAGRGGGRVQEDDHLLHVLELEVAGVLQVERGALGAPEQQRHAVRGARVTAQARRPERGLDRSGRQVGHPRGGTGGTTTTVWHRATLAWGRAARGGAW